MLEAWYPPVEMKPVTVLAVWLIGCARGVLGFILLSNTFNILPHCNES